MSTIEEPQHYLFYPGCSNESSARAYYLSLMAISDPLGLELEEIQDWNCCGATEYLGISLIPAYALITRNLALASQQSNGTRTVVASCSACYLNLAKADHYMLERPSLGEKVNSALSAGGLSYKPGSLQIRHLLDVIINDIGLDKVKDQVVKPLHGLRVAPYLGCMVPRPDYEKRWSDSEYPDRAGPSVEGLGRRSDRLPIEDALLRWAHDPDQPLTAFELIRRLISSADQYQADLMVTLCPMCQMNLDAYQNETNHYFHTHYNMPILFFTQLMGLAFGLQAQASGYWHGAGRFQPGAQSHRRGSPRARTARADASRAVSQQGLPMPRMAEAEEGEE